METTDPPAAVLCREVRGRGGRVHRVGESDTGLPGHGRIRVAVLPWPGVAGIGCAVFACVATRDGPRTARLGGVPGLFWTADLWVPAQAAVVLSAGRLRASGRLSARAATTGGAAGTLPGCLALAPAPGTAAASVLFGVVAGGGAGLVHGTCPTPPGRWYPERRGAAAACTASGPARGAVPLLLGAGRAGQRSLLAVTGAAVRAARTAAGRFFRDPPRNRWPAHAGPLTVPAGRAARRRHGKNPPAPRRTGPARAVRTPALWLMALCLLGTAGVTVLDVLLVPSRGRAPGLGPAAMGRAAVAGGAGAAAVGAVSDLVERRSALAVALPAPAAAQPGVPAARAAGSAPLLLGRVAAAALAGGAVLPLVVASAADHFGEHHGPSTCALLAGAWLPPVLAGTGTTAAAARPARGAFAPAGCTALACAAAALFLESPGLPTVRRIVPDPHPLGEEMA
ncbi:MFS transporter [Streptomyces sp. NPDC006743]|uniref:MFS transporter n=1 Tax=Streptomyces sp. NPDC006743 TaxID=3154480 RepID=UPI003453F02B